MQIVDRVADGPPLEDMILYQDEHSYRLPIMMQAVTEHFVLQGSILLEYPDSSSRINSRELFAFWETPCRCEEIDCIVVLPEQVPFGGDLESWTDGCAHCQPSCSPQWPY